MYTKKVKIFEDFVQDNADMLGMSREEYTAHYLSEGDAQSDEMAYGQLERCIDFAKMIRNRYENGFTLDSWMYNKIAIAEDYLNTVFGALDGGDGEIEEGNNFVTEKKSDSWSPYQKADVLASDMFGAMGLYRLEDDELDQIIDLKKADKLAKKQFGEFGFKTLAAKEMEDLLDSNPKLLREAFIGPFVFNDKMSDEELLGMYNGALDGYANYAKGMHYSKSDYKNAYQEIEKILKKRGVSVDEEFASEAVVNEWGSSDQSIMNKAIHKDAGSPKTMPSPFDKKLRRAAEDAVDFYWDDWEEYETDRDGLIDDAVRGYLRQYFRKDWDLMVRMFEPA